VKTPEEILYEAMTGREFVPKVADAGPRDEWERLGQSFGEYHGLLPKLPHADDPRVLAAREKAKAAGMNVEAWGELTRKDVAESERLKADAQARRELEVQIEQTMARSGK
jgi:hypothetical protein